MNKQVKYNLSVFKIFGLFLTLIGFFSCDLNVNEELIEYVIINDSDHAIEIIPIPTTNNFGETKAKFTLRKNDLYSETRLWNERFDGDQGFSTFLGTDRLKIIFGTQRKIIYSFNRDNDSNNCDDSRNLLRTLPETVTNRVEYIFTNDDFECAIICEDACI